MARLSWISCISAASFLMHSKEKSREVINSNRYDISLVRFSTIREAGLDLHCVSWATREGWHWDQLICQCPSTVGCAWVHAIPDTCSFNVVVDWWIFWMSSLPLSAFCSIKSFTWVLLPLFALDYFLMWFVSLHQFKWGKDTFWLHPFQRLVFHIWFARVLCWKLLLTQFLRG